MHVETAMAIMKLAQEAQQRSQIQHEDVQSTTVVMENANGNGGTVVHMTAFPNGGEWVIK